MSTEKSEKPTFEVIEGGKSLTNEQRKSPHSFWEIDTDHAVDVRTVNPNDYPESKDREKIEQEKAMIIAGVESFPAKYTEKIRAYEKKLHELQELTEKEYNVFEMGVRETLNITNRVINNELIPGKEKVEHLADAYSQGLPDELKYSTYGDKKRKEILGTIRELKEFCESMLESLKHKISQVQHE